MEWNRSRARGSAGRDLRHVPEHRLAGVQVRGGDEKQPALRILGGDGVQHRLIHFLLHQLPERRVVGHGVAGDHGQEGTRLQDVPGGDGGVKLLELVVVRRSEEGKRGDQRPGADAGHQLELGPVAGDRPTIQEPRAEGAVVAAARHGQKYGGRHRSLVPARREIVLLAQDGLDGLAHDRIPVDARAIADVSQTRHDGLCREGRWDGVLSHRSGAACQHHGCEKTGRHTLSTHGSPSPCFSPPADACPSTSPSLSVSTAAWTVRRPRRPSPTTPAHTPPPDTQGSALEASNLITGLSLVSRGDTIEIATFPCFRRRLP